MNNSIKQAMAEVKFKGFKEIEKYLRESENSDDFDFSEATEREYIIEYVAVRSLELEAAK